MAANDRLMDFFIEEHRLHDAGIDAFTAADAFLRTQKDATTRTVGQRAAGTCLQAGRVKTSDADNCYKTACHSAGGFDFDRAFGQGMILSVDNRADVHACKTSDALIHLSGL